MQIVFVHLLRFSEMILQKPFYPITLCSRAPTDNWPSFALLNFLNDILLKVRYEYYNNCNFTEVGEPFAEQPYAVAVQQGSHLQEEISKVKFGLMVSKSKIWLKEL